MKRSAMASLIDHTVLKPEATTDEVKAATWDAYLLGCASVCVNPSRVPLAVSQGAEVPVCTVVGFPLGVMSPSLKAAEAGQALACGATEIDMVLDFGLLKDGYLRVVERDIAAVRAVTDGALLKVILETSALTFKEVRDACLIARDAGADFVKTSTGFHSSGGATVEAVAVMAATVPDLGVKASGGIRDLPTALAMLDAGATRLGTSVTAALLADLTD
jgi:deoxyribose-phosphate aldolase